MVTIDEIKDAEIASMTNTVGMTYEFILTDGTKVTATIVDIKTLDEQIAQLDLEKGRKQAEIDAIDARVAELAVYEAPATSSEAPSE